MQFLERGVVLAIEVEHPREDLTRADGCGLQLDAAARFCNRIPESTLRDEVARIRLVRGHVPGIQLDGAAQRRLRPAPVHFVQRRVTKRRIRFGKCRIELDRADGGAESETANIGWRLTRNEHRSELIVGFGEAGIGSRVARIFSGRSLEVLDRPLGICRAELVQKRPPSSTF